MSQHEQDDTLQECGDLVGRALNVMEISNDRDLHAYDIDGDKGIPAHVHRVEPSSQGSPENTKEDHTTSIHSRESMQKGDNYNDSNFGMIGIREGPSEKAAQQPVQPEIFEEQPLGDPVQSEQTHVALEAPREGDEASSLATATSTHHPSHEPVHNQADDAHLPIRITIKEPEKIESSNALGLKSHFVLYAVSTNSSLPEMVASNFEVKRRFSDFDVLHKVLKLHYRGFIIPALPEKSYIDGRIARENFIRLRRADLQAFMKGIARHPVLRESEPVKTFLLQPGDLSRNPAWTYLVQPPSGSGALSGAGETASAAAGIAPGQLKAGIESWVSWVKSSVNHIPLPKHEPSSEEVHLRQSKDMLKTLQKMLEMSEETARVLCSHEESMCGDYRDLGKGLAALCRYDEALQSKVGQYTEEGGAASRRAEDLNRIALGSARQHAIWKTLSLRTAANLVALHDYSIAMPEAIAALEVREAALQRLWSLEDSLVLKQQQLQGSPTAATSDKRVLSLQHSVAQLKDQIHACQEEYQMLLQRNQVELKRMNWEREADFKHMLHAFAQTQAQLLQASADIWSSLEKQFKP